MTSQEKTTNKPLLLKLYKTGKQAEVHPSFKAKLAQKRRHYPELELFKIQLEEEQNDAHPHLYTEARQKLFSYRLTFLAFTFLFLCFTGMIQTFSLNWSYSLIFDSSIKAKSLISSITLLLSLASLACAYLPSTLHEATRHVVSKAKKALRSVYEKQKIHNDLKFPFLWGESYRKKSALRHMYQEILHKVEEKGEATYHLLKKIAKTPALAPAAKEKLYNQALAELHDRLCFKVHSFKHLEVGATHQLQLT